MYSYHLYQLYYMFHHESESLINEDIEQWYLNRREIRLFKHRRKRVSP